ncbi:hypothetical protein L218DRAFT_948634 [Marasmius fiardii PR-910]|nr:hypothetical protein L218DRAFT_948634 [Marasmius fiardii PR-910]
MNLILSSSRICKISYRSSRTRDSNIAQHWTATGWEETFPRACPCYIWEFIITLALERYLGKELISTIPFEPARELCMKNPKTGSAGSGQIPASLTTTTGNEYTVGYTASSTAPTTTIPSTKEAPPTSTQANVVVAPASSTESAQDSSAGGRSKGPEDTSTGIDGPACSYSSIRGKTSDFTTTSFATRSQHPIAAVTTVTESTFATQTTIPVARDIENNAPVMAWSLIGVLTLVFSLVVVFLYFRRRRSLSRRSTKSDGIISPFTVPAPPLGCYAAHKLQDERERARTYPLSDVDRQPAATETIMPTESHAKGDCNHPPPPYRP